MHKSPIRRKARRIGYDPNNRLYHQRTDGNLLLNLNLRQFPMIPAFAMAIETSQGQIREHVEIYSMQANQYLPMVNCTVYVSLSRVRNPANIKLLTQAMLRSMTSPWTKCWNIYKMSIISESIRLNKILAADTQTTGSRPVGFQ